MQFLFISAALLMSCICQLCLCQSVSSLPSQHQQYHRQLIQGIPPLLFQGQLLDDLQTPINNATIQFWQTDPNGLYNHPNAAGSSSSLDPSFQYFGTSSTDEQGKFYFLTHRPGVYSGRPTHFHYKVWIGEQEKLTSQFYFDDEDTRYSEMQVIQLQEYEFDNGRMGYVTNKTIVLDMGLGGAGPFTPKDVEGPFYPVLDFFGYGNDLIRDDANLFIGDDIESGVMVNTATIEPIKVDSFTNTATTTNIDSPTYDVFDVQSSLTAHRSIWWQSVGEDNNYNMTFERMCYCTETYRGPFDIQVRDGNVYSAIYTDTKIKVTDTDILQGLLTVEGVMDQIQRGLDEKYVELQVQYDTMGYPKKFYSDRSKMIADDEITYLISDVVVISISDDNGQVQSFSDAQPSIGKEAIISIENGDNLTTTDEAIAVKDVPSNEQIDKTVTGDSNGVARKVVFGPISYMLLLQFVFGGF